MGEEKIDQLGCDAVLISAHGKQLHDLVADDFVERLVARISDRGGFQWQRGGRHCSHPQKNLHSRGRLLRSFDFEKMSDWQTKSRQNRFSVERLTEREDLSLGV